MLTVPVPVVDPVPCPYPLEVVEPTEDLVDVVDADVAVSVTVTPQSPQWCGSAAVGAGQSNKFAIGQKVTVRVVVTTTVASNSFEPRTLMN